MPEAVGSGRYRLLLQLRMHVLRVLHCGDEKHLPQLPRRTGTTAQTREEAMTGEYWDTETFLAANLHE